MVIPSAIVCFPLVACIVRVIILLQIPSSVITKDEYASHQAMDKPQRRSRGDQLYRYFQFEIITSDNVDESFADREKTKKVQLWKQPHFQGDIAKVDSAQMKRLFPSKQRLAAANQQWIWPSRVIPIEIPYGMFNDQELEVIHTALARIQRETCVSFRWRSNGETEYITFSNIPGLGCSSTGIGREFHVNVINLKIDDPNIDCFTDSTVMHELMHAVGLHHEHSRFDRDAYIKINRDNVDPDLIEYLDIVGLPNYGVYGLPYDYLSITHYDQFAFGKDGKVVIEPLDSAYRYQIGVFSVMSEGDRKKVNRMFGCPMPDPRTWNPYYRTIPYWTIEP